MRILESKTERVAIDALRPHPRNPREGDIGAIHQSIENNGFYGSVIAQKSTGFILAGNHRWQAAQQQGATEIPVTWIDVDDDHALRILLADNRTNDLASYNDNELAELLQTLRDETGTLAGTGYDGDDLDELLDDLGLAHDAGTGDPPEAQTDRADELREKWGTEVGQVWQIGPHRLLCGDSTKEADLQRLFGEQKAHMVFTDPPYGVDYDGGTKKHAKLENDHRATGIYGDFLPLALRFSDPKAPFYLWHADRASMPVLEALAANRLEVRAQIIWNKNQAQFGSLSAQYKQKHEPCFYCYRKGQAPYWHGPTNEVTVWDLARERVNEYHPTQKPPELAERAIRNSSKRGAVVADFFAGSGSTILGAESTGRACYAVEFQPGYTAVILERLSDAGLTPELAE